VIYYTNNTEHRALLFSKEMVNEYRKAFNKTVFFKATDIYDAFEKIKPKNYNSTKIYAIQNGRVIGMFINYEDFRKFTDGYTSFKGKRCKSVKDGYRYIYNANVPKNLRTNHCEQQKSITTPEINKKYPDAINYKAYTDGSQYCDNNIMGVGYEIYCDGRVFSHSSFIKLDKKTSSTTAELMSVMMAVERSIDEGLKSLTIVHDNEQVETFAKSPSKNNPFSKEYHNFMQQKSGLIDVYFEKVKSHSGNEQNDKVDRMIRHKKIDKFIELL
jgi:ribonuclease HI